MKIEVIPFAGAINSNLVVNKTIVVIDVLRATSVIITALKNGAKEIIPCLSIEDAKQNAAVLLPGSFLLCGERDAKKIEGFDLGNSPLEFTREVIENKSLIITTSNGTKAINACRKARNIYIGAFLNLDAVVEKIKQDDEVVLVCSGTNGRFSLDDGICAAAIIKRLSEQKKLTIDDLGQSLLLNSEKTDKNLIQLLSKCYHLNYLIKNGFSNDVDYCLQTNVNVIIPRLSKENNIIIV